MTSFAILGAGVNGLTIGNILLDKHPDAKVTIYASKTTDIVSFVASAQFYPMWLGDDLPVDYDKTLRQWFMTSKEQFNSRIGT
ncbi:MAG: hypothetical protein WA030_03790, partial [Candidatus Microsaccharimonas sp.]